MRNFIKDKIVLPFLIVISILVVRIFAPQITYYNQADGFAYYLPLRSLLYDRDVDFSNENKAYEKSFNSLPYDWKHPTQNNLYFYPYSVGPSILWSPFILMFGSQAQKIPLIKPIKELEENEDKIEYIGGYSLSDLIALVLSSQIYGILAIILTYLILLKLFPSDTSIIFFTNLSIVLATPFFYYFRYQPLMSHILSAFTTSLFLYFWIREIFLQRWSRFFYLGVGLGIISLVRWQDTIFVIFPLVELTLLSYQENFKKILNKVVLLLSLLVGWLIIFLPQFIFWKLIYGAYFVMPQGSSFFNLNAPYLNLFLFSFRHGLFTWSPIVILSTLGLILFFRKVVDKTYLKASVVFAISSILVIVISILINSSIEDWHGSDSFGARRTVSIFPIYAFGLSAFLLTVKKSLRFIVLPIIMCFIIYNVIFASFFSRGIIDHYKPVTPLEVINHVKEIYFH